MHLINSCIMVPVQLVHCNVAGLDSSTPVSAKSAKSGRLFLFEVQAMAVGSFSEPVVYLFQALSKADMEMWASSFQKAKTIIDGGGGDDSGISGPVGLAGTTMPSPPPPVRVPEPGDEDSDEDKL